MMAGERAGAARQCSGPRGLKDRDWLLGSGAWGASPGCRGSLPGESLLLPQMAPSAWVHAASPLPLCPSPHKDTGHMD